MAGAFEAIVSRLSGGGNNFAGGISGKKLDTKGIFVVFLI
jgi:hypothetical protein